jgi:transposase-like protein
MESQMHIGELIEELIRVNHLSISEVARKMHVNRRSLYNWFKQQSIRPYILHRICNVLANDFAIELPSIIKETPRQDDSKHKTQAREVSEEVNSSSVSYWMNKYIYLLEKYNEMLAKTEGTGRFGQHHTESYR